MKQVNPEAIKGTTVETTAANRVEAARAMVAKGEMEAQQKQTENMSLDIELQKAEAAHEQKERAEREAEGKSEKVAELTGGRG